MKKTFFTLMLMLASVVAINAQSLTSNAWMTVVPGENEAVIVFNFEDDGTCAIVIAGEEVEEEAGMKMTFTMAAMVPGTYTLKGDILNYKLNVDNSDFNIDYEIEGVDAQTKKMMDAMLKPELEKQKKEMKKEMLKDMPLPENGNFKVVSVDKEKLVLADEDGAEMTFVPAPND